MDKQEKRRLMWTLAFGIALLPPIWAVLSASVGITTGAVALIVAGVYVANGNKIKDAPKIAIGFLLGDLWAVIAIFIMEKLQWHPMLELFLTLLQCLGELKAICKSFQETLKELLLKLQKSGKTLIPQ